MLQRVPASSEERDLAAAFTAVSIVMREWGQVRYVAGADLAPEARRAINGVVQLTDAAGVTGAQARGLAGLPAGYLVVHVLTIANDTGAFAGTRGPVPLQRTGFGCGTKYLFQLARTSGGWKVEKQDFIQC
jgi:hypothetical protein